MPGDSVWNGLRLYDGHLDRLFAAALHLDLDIGKTREDKELPPPFG